MSFACPNCGEDLQATVEAELPETTDLTISLTITPGQLVLAKTVAGVIENWAEMQVAIGAALDCKTEVFIAGLSYENDRIDITTRIVNAPRDTDGSPKGTDPQGLNGEAATAGAEGIAQPSQDTAP